MTKKWEYKTEMIACPRKFWGGFRFTAVEKELNKLGQQGWEAITIKLVHGGIFASFKRPLHS